MMGLLLGLFIGGGVITETVFARQGIGALLVTSILVKDYPVVQALLLLTTAAYVLANVLVDLLYGVIDPRVRFG
jgi:ABC-type dipeptide/oligopeptide/nickel transport system permease component